MEALRREVRGCEQLIAEGMRKVQEGVEERLWPAAAVEGMVDEVKKEGVEGVDREGGDVLATSAATSAAAGAAGGAAGAMVTVAVAATAATVAPHALDWLVESGASSKVSHSYCIHTLYSYSVLILCTHTLYSHCAHTAFILYSHVEVSRTRGGCECTS
jgi:hypothetical protein